MKSSRRDEVREDTSAERVPPAAKVKAATLDELFVLGHYWHPDAAVRTPLGQLIHDAKDATDPAAIERLASLMADRAPTRLVDLQGPVVIGAIPPDPSVPNRLPIVLARALADAGVGEWAEDLVARSRSTARARDAEPGERPGLVRSAGYRARPVDPGSTVVLVDDVILTGTTLAHVAACVRAAGARAVIGVAMARTRRL